MDKLLESKEAWDDFLIKLKNHKHPFIKNPFAVEGFALEKQDFIFPNLVESYKINNTIVKFYGDTQIIEIVSPKDDAYIGAFASLLTFNDNFAHDSNAQVWVYSKIIEIPDTQSEYIYNVLDCMTKADVELKIRICYSNTSSGNNAFLVNWNSLIYMIDRYHLDDYYVNLEFDRRLKASPHRDSLN